VQKDRYTLAEQSLTIRNIAVTALLEYMDLVHVLCLQVAMAAGDYPSSNHMCYSGGTATSPFCCNAWAATTKSTLAVQPIFCCNSKTILS